ncbi:hypothetical protein JKP88DRAFT_337271 [Tribonema minus]|uniref:Uncharacterized protein n=1 Tax=Tribonema minus TaxID=303371 RepID=A0A835YI62_9STRA|nr:hypothetical protein JKP88DRAFT_337271 [Tribonema minus]
MVKEAEEAYGFVCARVEAMTRQLVKGEALTALGCCTHAKLRSRLCRVFAGRGCGAVWTAIQLSAVGGRFRGLEPLVAGLAAARDRWAEAAVNGNKAAAKQPKSCEARSAALKALGDRTILSHVLQFASRRSWVFIAGVSSHWRGVYMATCALHFGLAHLLRTAWREAFSSVDMFIAAADAGALDKKEQPALCHQLGRWGTRALLACATGVEFNVSLDGSMLVGAAKSGCPDWFMHLGRLLVKRRLVTLKAAVKAAVAAARCGDNAVAAARCGDDGSMLGWITSLKLAGMPEWIVAGMAAVAAWRGHLHTLWWVNEHKDDWGVANAVMDCYDLPRKSLEEGASYGCFQRDETAEHFAYYDIIDMAVRAGHWHIVQYVVSEQVACPSGAAIALAVQLRRVDMAKVLLDSLEDIEYERFDDVMPALARERSCPVKFFLLIRARSTFTWSPEFLSEVLTMAEEVQNATLAAWLLSIGAVRP